ncbi:MAG: hypothetical protein JWQ38_218 [Flavipsychrobacter sp.]|nr:hypothetical protein [Flavipsychrobacter sp.]
MSVFVCIPSSIKYEGFCELMKTAYNPEAAVQAFPSFVPIIDGVAENVSAEAGVVTDAASLLLLHEAPARSKPRDNVIKYLFIVFFAWRKVIAIICNEHQSL